MSFKLKILGLSVLSVVSVKVQLSGSRGQNNNFMTQFSIVYLYKPISDLISQIKPCMYSSSEASPDPVFKDELIFEGPIFLVGESQVCQECPYDQKGPPKFTA